LRRRPCCKKLACVSAAIAASGAADAQAAEAAAAATANAALALAVAELRTQVKEGHAAQGGVDLNNTHLSRESKHFYEPHVTRFEPLDR